MRRAKGSITWPAPGVFRVSVELGTVNGKRKRLSETGRGKDRDAKAALDSLLLRAEKVRPEGTMRLDDFLHVVYVPALRKRVKKGTIRQETVDGYVYNLNRFVLPHLESAPMYTLSTPVITDWLGKLEDEGATVQQVIHAGRALRAALNDAEEREVIDRCPRFKLPPVPNRDLRVLTVEEAVRILNHFAGHRMLPAIVLSLGCGLSLSEMAGLAWSDFDFTANTVTVSRTLHATSKGLKTEDTKTPWRKAAVTMPAFVADTMKAGRGLGPVFGCRPDAISRSIRRHIARGNKEIREKEAPGPELPTIPLRDYRHSHATFVAALGTSNVILARRQRHRDISTSYHYYIGENADADAAVAASLDSMFALHLATSRGEGEGS